MLASSFIKFSIGPWLSALISFAATPVITWLILPAEFGKASLFVVAYTFLVTIAGMGTDQSFLRMFHERSEKNRSGLMLQSLIPPLIFTAVVSTVLLTFPAKFSYLLFGSGKEGSAIVILCLMLFFGLLERYASLLLRIQNKGMQYSTVKLLGAIVNTSLVLIIAYFATKSFYAIILALLVSTIASFLIAVAMELNYWERMASSRDFNGLNAILSFGLPYVPTFLLDSLFQSFDKFSLRNYSTLEELGIYSTALKLVSALTLVQAGFANFWTPLAYEKYHNDPDHKLFFSDMFSLVTYLMMTLGLLLILSKDLIVLVFSEKYRMAASIMPLLLFMPLLYTVSEVTVVGINISKRTRLHLWVMVFSLAACVVANLILVPKYGTKGAAGAIAVSYTMFFYTRTFLSQKAYPVKYDLLKFNFSYLLLLFCAFVNTIHLHMIYQMISGLVSLVILTILFRSQAQFVYQETRKFLFDRVVAVDS